LGENKKGIQDQRLLALTLGFAPQQTLDEKLVCPVGGHGQECPPEDTPYNSIRGREEAKEASSPIGVENLELVGARSRGSGDTLKSPRKAMQDERHGSDGSAQINEELHDIHGHHSFEAAGIRVKEGESTNEQDALRVLESGDHMHRNGRGKEPHA